jgi:hypothetical protein
MQANHSYKPLVSYLARFSTAPFRKFSACSYSPRFLDAALREIIWQSGFKFQPIFRHWVKKTEPPSMQHLPAVRIRFLPIQFVAKHWMPNRLHMDPDLMCPSGKYLAKNQRQLF